MALTLAVIVLPLMGAGITALLAARWRAAAVLAAATATLAAAVGLAGGVLEGGRAELLLPGPGSLVGVLIADGLSSGLVLVSTTVTLGTAGFALLHRAGPGGLRPAFWPLSLALLAGLHGLFLAGDLLTAYLMLELVAVAGAAMVAWSGGRDRLAAGTRYFYAELVASVTFLVGTASVWSAAGTVVIAELPGQLGGSATGRLGLGLLTLGLLLKVPVVPLHFWLPAAHTLAPSAASPLLSALVVKSAFVVLLRLWASGVPELATTALAQLLGTLGATAVVWGGVTALRAERVKQVIAYSTVAQLGLLLVAVPMVMAGSAEAWVGGVFHAIAHALPKAAVLMAVALLAVSMGADTVDRLDGAAVRRPLAAFTVGVGGLSLIGLPPTGGFVAKWYLMVASITTGQWWWAVTIVIGSLLTAAYLARLLQRCFGSASTTGTTAPLPTERRGTDVVALGLASSALLLGLYPNRLLGLLEVGAPLGAITHG